jgi:hypothetical protein
MFDEKYDSEIYAKACDIASVENKHFLNNVDIEDEKALALFNALAKKMHIHITLLFDAFG